MKLFQTDDRGCHEGAALVDELVEANLQVNCVLFVHIDHKVYGRHNHEGEEHTKDDVEVELKDPRTPLREEEVFGIVQDAGA